MATQQRMPIDEAAAAEARRLSDDPNVACVGFGLKIVKGKPTFEVVLQYHVRTKFATEDEIKRCGSRPIPGDAQGYRTDVVPWTVHRRTACPPSHPPTGDRGSRVEDPLVGGTSTTVLGDFHSFPTGYGTLGAICFDASTGESMALSNAHVYGDDIGNDAVQPWLSVGSYVGGTFQWLLCGGPLSHLFFWTAPTPLTDILTGAAAAAWVAAAASDAEDPNRWGQRTTPPPPAGATTGRERVRLEAGVPHLPFPGRRWAAKARWDYSRETTAGPIDGSITEERPNDHALVGKRVFTDRDAYTGGDTVRICAEIWTPAGKRTPERFVVAHSFPVRDPARRTRRVLLPGALCARVDASLEPNRKPACRQGFNPQVPGVATVNFPLLAPPFVLIGQGSTVLLDASAPGNPSGRTALRIPDSPLPITCPPSTHVELTVFHHNRPIRATAISANGDTAAQVDSTGATGVVQTLRLIGPEITRVVVEGGGGEGYIAEICVDKRRLNPEPWKGVSSYYSGTFTLPLDEPDGRWAVVVVTQTIDDTPTGGDPIRAAGSLGGIVDSANVVETGECSCEVLFDHTFDVRAIVIT